jgi:hypothetical protein
MGLFEASDRTAEDPKPNGERDFDYLDRSGKPEAARVREFLDLAFSNWPSARQPEMRARLTDGDYRSASFELILHEILKRRGRSPQIEVPKEGTTKRPDFLVESAVGSFYLEAILATEARRTSVADRKRLDELLDAINRRTDPNFFVSVDVVRYGPGQPSARTIVAFLRGELKKLDPDSDSTWTDKNGYLGPKLRWEGDGWSIVFHAMPKRRDARGKANRRMVGAVADRLWVPGSAQPVRNAVKEKGGRYGAMNRPYIVAVNVITPWLDEIDLMNALFGTEFFTDHGTGSLVFGRDSDGVFGTTANPRYTRVSAVAFFEDVHPWNVASSDALLVHNPHAKHPLPAGTLGIRECTYTGGQEPKPGHAGVPLSELLGLPAEWPRV